MKLISIFSDLWSAKNYIHCAGWRYEL